jgi:long-chain acyl-CoA synthetase
MDDFGVRYFASEKPHAPALVDPSGRAWPRGELLEFADKTARAFAAAGLDAGDAVAIVAPNCNEFLGVHLGAVAAGLYVVPVNWHLADAEIAYILDNSSVRAIVAHAALGVSRLAALAKHAASARVLAAIGGAPGFVALEDLLASAAPRKLAARERGRIMPYTSATTGRPKAVRLPLAGSYAALRKFVAWQTSLGVALEDGNVHLCPSMLYHAAPLEGATAALEMGHCVVLTGVWEPETTLRLIDKHGVTTTFMVPTMFVRLLKLDDAVRARYSHASLRFVVHGGAPCPPDVKRRMIDWWGPLVWEAYGAAEAQGVVASSADWLARPGTVGKPTAGASVRILDASGNELPPGSVGLIYLVPHTGESFEYLGDAEKTRACRRGDFITVGDLGYVDADGYLYVCGRQSEMIISSGMNIYPAEIEQLLIEHPRVTDCAVVGMAHELFGEVPRAVVELAPGDAPDSRLRFELMRFLAVRLAPMKLPRRIDFAARLPRDPNGKLLRRLIPTEGNEPDGRQL